MKGLFRRATIKDAESGEKLFLGAQGLIESVFDEKFFDDHGFEQQERSAIKEATSNGQVVKTFVISDETVDRHGDTVSLKGWVLKHYNNVVLLNHGMKAGGELPIATAAKVWRHGSQLKSVAIFAHKDVYPFGDMIGKMVEAELIKGASVGFMPLEFAKSEREDRKDRWGYPGIDFTKQELTEWSVVPIGSNRNAMALSYESLEGAKEADIDLQPLIEATEEAMAADTNKESLQEVLAQIWQPKVFKGAGISVNAKESSSVQDEDFTNFVEDLKGIWTHG